jgi:hypothetical protein
MCSSRHMITKRREVQQSASATARHATVATASNDMDSAHLFAGLGSQHCCVAFTYSSCASAGNSGRLCSSVIWWPSSARGMPRNTCLAVYSSAGVNVGESGEVAG